MYPQEPHWGVSWKNLKSLKLTPNLRASTWAHLCNKVWIQDPLDNSSKWPVNDTLDQIILKDLHTYRQQSGKWKDVPYIQAFIYLRSHPSLCSTCSPTQLLFAMKPTQPPLDDSITQHPANELLPFHSRPASTLPKTHTAGSVSPSHQDTPEPTSSISSDPSLPSVPDAVCSNPPALAPTFTPPTMCS